MKRVFQVCAGIMLAALLMGAVATPVYLAVSGGRLTGPLVVPQLNKTIMVDQEPGSTADLKYQACITALTALGGGTCDGTGFGATTQTIASTVTTASNVFLKLSRATTYIPGSSSVDPFSLAENSGIEGLSWNGLAVSNYAGTVVKFLGTCVAGDHCYVRDFKIVNGTNSTNPQTGTAILLSAASTVNALENVRIEDGQIIGFNFAIHLTSTGSIGSTNFVNGNVINNVVVTNAVHCFTLYANPGDVTGNTSSGLQCEAGAGNIVGATGLWFHGQSGSNLKGNQLINFNAWDYGQSVAQAAYTLDANTFLNYVQGNIPVGLYDTSSDSGPAGSNNLPNLAFPLSWNYLSARNFQLVPPTGHTIFWWTANSSNQACLGSGGTPPGGDPFCIDAVGNIYPTGKIIGHVGDPVPIQGGAGTTYDMTVVNAAGSVNNATFYDNGNLGIIGSMNATGYGTTGGASWTSGTGAPSGNCSVGSLYSNTTGSSVSTLLYRCYPANTWNAVP